MDKVSFQDLNWRLKRLVSQEYFVWPEHFRSMLWRNFYNWLLPLKLRARVWNWVFPKANFRKWDSLPWWTWKE